MMMQKFVTYPPSSTQKWTIEFIQNLRNHHRLQTGVMERKLIIIPSFKIYGGVAGFFDFGPPGCAVKQNITQLWRQHFILEENMLEVWVLLVHNAWS